MELYGSWVDILLGTIWELFRNCNRTVSFLNDMCLILNEFTKCTPKPSKLKTNDKCFFASHATSKITQYVN